MNPRIFRAAAFFDTLNRMAKLFIPILLGTAREGRWSEHVARYVLAEAKRYGAFEAELADVRDFVTVPKTEGMPDDAAKRWSALMGRADGLIIVAPEYNHGYPGELKLMLDELHDEYARKPAAICAVSKGGIGGARMAEVLRIALIDLHMTPIRTAVYFSNVRTLFDERGVIADPSYHDRMTKLFDELVWYARA